MAELVSVNADVVGIDTDFNGTDECCINSLYAQEATPNGIGVVYDVCGDVWVSQIKEDGGVLWNRTYAGKYSNEVREKITVAARREKKVKLYMALSFFGLLLFVILWNVSDFYNQKDALASVLLSTFAIVIIGGSVAVALFGRLFRQFSRNSKKLKYEIRTSDTTPAAI